MESRKQNGRPRPPPQPEPDDESEKREIYPIKSSRISRKDFTLGNKKHKNGFQKREYHRIARAIASAQDPVDKTAPQVGVGAGAEVEKRAEQACQTTGTPLFDGTNCKSGEAKICTCKNQVKTCDDTCDYFLTEDLPGDPCGGTTGKRFSLLKGCSKGKEISCWCIANGKAYCNFPADCRTIKN